MIHIDGSYMEGGGQIVRTALALSTLTGKPFRVDKIRHNRSKPGLKRQHVSCIYLSDFKNIAELAAHLKDVVPKISLCDRSGVVEVLGKSSASTHLKGAQVAERQARGAAEILERDYSPTIRYEYQDTASPGSVITLWTASKAGSGIAAADALGEKGVRAEKVGAAAAQKLRAVLSSKAVVDHHLADNLVPLLALAGGTIVTDKITGHIRSNIHVCEKFLDVSFCIDETENRIAAEL